MARRVSLLVTCVIALATTACSKRQYQGGEYRDSEMAFRLGPIPEGSRELEADEALVAFRNDDAAATIAVGGRCGLDGDDVPLRSLVQHLFLQFTERTTISETEMRLDGRDALDTEMEASLDGVRKHFVIIVLKKDGCVYDFIHVDPGGDGADVVESRRSFREMVKGFRTVD